LRLTQGNGQEIREALPDTAFDANWRSGHDAVTSFAERREAGPTLAQKRPFGEVTT
jgi:hypothetical protein